MTQLTSIVIVNLCPSIGETEVLHAAAALQLQVHRDFSLPPPNGWGVSCNVRAASAAAPVRADEWQLLLLGAPDQPGALGDHDRTANGLPLMRVFPLLDAQDGVSWTSTASHEILETLADPECCRAAQAPDGRFYALEVCDAVEALSYKIHGVEVSDFVTPAYFEPPKAWRTCMMDFMHAVSAPFKILPGGYGQVWDATKGWQQVEAAAAPRARRASSNAAAAHGRRVRRAKIRP